MSLRFVLVVSWAFPGMLLAWVIYNEIATVSAPVVETNARMRTRMCREHVAAAKADPKDAITRQAVDECVLAGYITREDVEIALD
jgi:hypothetical protein